MGRRPVKGRHDGLPDRRHRTRRSPLTTVIGLEVRHHFGLIFWSYGHPGVTGSEPGYLHEPDDAYLLKNGNVSVADAENCRVLLISHTKKILEGFGSPGSCTHEPPHLLGSPNGDTPPANGDILVSEVNGPYIDEITPEGWSYHPSHGERMLNHPSLADRLAVRDDRRTRDRSRSPPHP